MILNGIDVSKHNGVIDFEQVKKAGFDFVIIRAGYGKALTQVDPYFEQNYKRAKLAGLKVGAYWYSYTQTVAGAIREAETCLEAIKGKCFELPIYYDVEEKDQLAQGTQFLGDIIDNFCQTLEKAGKFAGLYMSAAHLKLVPMKVLVKYAIWCAQWGKACTYELTRWGVWQYSSTGSVPGIQGNVDLNKMVIDYPTIIKNAKLNGYNDIFDLGLMEQRIINEEALDILRECKAKLEELRNKYM